MARAAIVSFAPPVVIYTILPLAPTTTPATLSSERITPLLPFSDVSERGGGGDADPESIIAPVLFKLFLALIVLMMIVVTTVGNALVCLAVLLVRKLKQPHNYLIISLAVADFFVGLLVMPLALADLMFSEWQLGREMCQLWTTADLTLCTASIVNLCMISVDRYLVISRPLRYSAQRTTKRMLVYIGIVWLLAALVGFSSHLIANLLEGSETQTNTKTCEVIQHFAYQIYATIIAFYAPTVIMVILYVKIWRAAKRLARQDKALSNNNNEFERTENSEIISRDHESMMHKERVPSIRIFKPDNKKFLHRPSTFLHAVKVPLIRHNDKNECKARKTLGVIMSVFIVCWFPFFFLVILKSCFGVSVPNWLDITALWLGYSNSTLNPAIYCKYNKEFRVPFREILSCRCGTLQHVMRQQSFNCRYGPSIQRRNDSHPECSDV